MAGSGSFNYFKFSPLLPSLIEELNISYWMVGLLAGAFGFSQLFLSIPTGFLLHPKNLKRWTNYALTSMIFGTLIAGFSPNPYLLFVGRAIEGVGMAIALVVAPSIVKEVTVKGRVGFGFGILMLYNPVGNILGLNMSSWLLNLFGWRVAWLAGITLPILTLLLLSRTRSIEVKMDGDPTSLGAREGLLIGLIQIGVSISCMGFLMWMPTYMMKIHNFDVTLASFIASLFMVIGIPTPPLGGWLLDRAKSKKLILIYSYGALSILYPLSSLMAGSLLPLHILIAGFFSGLIPTVINVCVVDLLGPSSSIGFGVLNASRGISMLLGPLIMGAILSVTSSWFLSFTSLAIFTLLSLISSFLLLAHPRHY